MPFKKKKLRFTHRKNSRQRIAVASKYNEKEKKLLKLWNNPKSGANFGGINALLREGKAAGIDGLNQRNVKQFLLKVHEYATTYPKRRRFPRAKTFARG